MKITHICLSGPYVEGFGYQENILTEFHVKQGHQVSVITSNTIFNNKLETQKRECDDYINQFGIHVKVLKRKNILGKPLFNHFYGVYERLSDLSPDIIFVHGAQFFALKDVIKYCKENKNVKFYIDQHGDYYNMPIKPMKNFIIHRFVYGFWIRRAAKFVDTFWGVTPWRCEYLNKVYGVSNDKIKLLVMGGDDRYINFNDRNKIRDNIRGSLELMKDDFVIITGGKIDKAKNIDLLMEAVKCINNEKIKLIVFGQPSTDLEKKIQELSKDIHIRNIGWIESHKVYDYFLSSDLAIFPGTHSVLWEQACACGIPCVFKHWEGMHHVDLGGNCNFLYNDSIEEIIQEINNIYNNVDKYKAMKEIAFSNCIKEFSYENIAKKAIGE